MRWPRASAEASSRCTGPLASDDFYVIAEVPSQAAAAALAATTGATGAVSISTVVLLTAEDIDAAVKLHPTYRAPGT